MADRQFIKLEGDPDELAWLPSEDGSEVVPYCLIHLARVTPRQYDSSSTYFYWYVCPAHPGHLINCSQRRVDMTVDNPYDVHSQLARDVFDREALKDLPIVRIDPEGYTTLAKERLPRSPHPEYWAEVTLKDSSKGLMLMVQAGKRDAEDQKVQLFVDLPAQRMSFDKSRKDQHPAGLFTQVEATFKDSKSVIEKKPDA